MTQGEQTDLIILIVLVVVTVLALIGRSIKKKQEAEQQRLFMNWYLKDGPMEPSQQATGLDAICTEMYNRPKSYGSRPDDVPD